MAETYEKRSGKATRQKYVKDRRDKVVQVRMNDAELSLLDEQRGTCSRSNFLRGELYASRYAPPSREVVLDVPALDRVRVELNRIGVNMNQIARARNRRLSGMGVLDAVREEMRTKDEAEAFREFRDSVDKLRAQVMDCVRICRRTWRREVMSDVNDACAVASEHARAYVVHRVRRGKAQTRSSGKRHGPHRLADG